MPRKGQRKCQGCGDWVDTLDDCSDSRYSREGELFCYGCWESGESYASTVVEIIPPEPGPFRPQLITSRFDADFNYLQTIYDGDNSEDDNEDFDWDEDYPAPVVAQGYHRSDAWRGHATFDFAPEFEIVSCGWVTGFPDETTRRKADIAELFEDIKSGAKVAPCTLYWVFGLTSNVFSIAVDIVVATEDRPALDAWLTEIGNDVETLDAQLS